MSIIKAAALEEAESLRTINNRTKKGMEVRSEELMCGFPPEEGRSWIGVST